MAHLQHMDARLDTLFTELYQVNVRVSCIAWRQAWRQAIMGGFALEASPPPPLVVSDSKAEDDDNGDDDDDEDANSTDKMST